VRTCADGAKREDDARGETGKKEEGKKIVSNTEEKRISRCLDENGAEINQKRVKEGHNSMTGRNGKLS